MPDTEYECITKEWLQTELRAASALNNASTSSISSTSISLTNEGGAGGGSGDVSGRICNGKFCDARDLIILDCRSSHEFSQCHIRSAVNFSIPSIMLRRLAAGKIDLLVTIKSPELKERIKNGYRNSRFILYNEIGVQHPQADEMGACGGIPLEGNDSTINVLHRRLKQDGCHVALLQDGFYNFHQAFPEWCEDDSSNKQNGEEMESSRIAQADQLMGLRSLRISTPHSDSACSSSAESSDSEIPIPQPRKQDIPVEIVPGLFLGNATHSGDSVSLQRLNIKYVLNVTPDLPNVFEGAEDMRYLQIPITDHYSQDLAVHFPEAIKFIDEANSQGFAVLVHCLAGVSRSVTVTLAYLMHKRAMCLNDAFTMVRELKPDISPNFHFMQQLSSFENQLNIRPVECYNGMEDECSEDCGVSGVSGYSNGNSDRTLTTTTNFSKSGKLCCSSPSTTKTFSSVCKCMQTGDFIIQSAKTTGVSPDSGIEFDRWTPSGDMEEFK